MADIFLSYASEDRDRIEPLINALEAEGWTVWWDRTLVAGPSFAEKIQEALDGARCVLVAWSKHSVSSNWCRDEANEGLERQCLVPLAIDDIRPPIGFRSAQTVFMSGWPQERTGLDALFEGVRRALAPVPSSTVDSGPKASQELSIAVLPFINMSSDPEQEFFCDGLVEDIIADLAHIPQLLVVSRNATFVYKGSTETIHQIAGQLGVNYVLQGSVRRAISQVRVIATLEDARTSRTLWSARFDRKFSDAFTLQDELTGEIVAALDAEILWGEQARHRRSKISNPKAGELLYKGLYEHYKFDRASTLTARKYFESFIELEPGSILGYVWLATSYGFAIVVGWEDPQVALPKLKSMVDQALAIEPEDAHALVGDAEFKTLVGDLEGAFAAIERSVERMPNFDEAWFFRGWIQMFRGEFEDSVVSLEHANRLCPTLNSVKLGVLGTAYRNAGKYEESIQTFKHCLQRYPDFLYAHTSMAVVYGLMGDLEAARREVAETLRMDPSYSVRRFVTPNLYRDPGVMEGCAEALRNAGMPEG